MYIKLILFRIEKKNHCNAKTNVVFATPYKVKLKYIFLPEDCNSDWLLFEGNCYFFGVSKLNWTDAQVYFKKYFFTNGKKKKLCILKSYISFYYHWVLNFLFKHE